VRLEGLLSTASVDRFTENLRDAMARKKDRVVLDLARLAALEESVAKRLAEGLRGYRDRIRVVLPRVGEFTTLAAIFSLYR
jgi:anti-anti-sigma regulatory factor